MSVMDSLEPHVENARTSDGKCGERYLTANETFQLSQAISLKRIADALSGTSVNVFTSPINTYGEGIWEAIQGQMIRGQRGIDQYEGKP